MKNKIQLLVIAVLIIFLHGCSFKKIGKDLGEGVAGTTDSIGHNLIVGIRDELTDPVTREKLSRFLDSLISNVADSVLVKTLVMRDSLFSRRLIIWTDSLVEAATGQKLKLNVESIQASLFGKTKADIFLIEQSVKDLLADILSKKNVEKIGLLRDELLGSKTNSAIVRIVDTAVSHIVDSAIVKLSKRYQSDLNPLLKEDISFVRKNATELLITLAALAAFIILLVWLNKRKYIRMVTLLTKQIHDIPDQHVYDLVTSKIKSEAVSTGLEPSLRNILSKNGMLGAEAWNMHKNKILN